MLALVAMAAAQSATACSGRTAIVAVVARRGTPILGVTASDLRVSAGRGTAVAAWQPAAGTAHAVLLVDTSGSMDNRKKLGRGAEAEELAFARAAPPGKLALSWFNDFIREPAGFGASAGRISTLIQTLSYGSGTALCDGVADAADVARGTGFGASVVVVSDGEDDASQLRAGQAVADALAANVRIFFIAPAATHGSARFFSGQGLNSRGRRTAERLTRVTGGLVVTPGRNLNRTATGLWAVIEHGYKLRLRLSRPRAKPLHWKLELTHAFLHVHPHARVLYPNPLPACRQPAKG